MTSGTRSKTGAKIGKPIDPDNSAESAFPKKVTATTKAKRSEAGRKAAATRRANQARKDALTETRDGTQSPPSTAASTGEPVLADSAIKRIVAATNDTQVSFYPFSSFGAFS
jgi:hypothetical protein